MNLEAFFRKFDLFADAPDAVAKMRELILHLAIHGQLVDQSKDDQPAIELLRKSRAVMSELMLAGKAKKEKSAASVTSCETTFSIPDGWAWCRLVDVGQFINGLAFKPSDWGVVGRPIIRIQNLSGRNVEYNRTTADYDPAVVVQDDDILVSWSATLDAFIWHGEEGVLNQHIFRVLPAPAFDRRYLFWLLKWVIRQLAGSDHAHGLVMHHINRGPFLAYPIPLPPLPEQKRIVAKVDELMALCDRLETEQQERETRHQALVRASLARFAEAPTPANLEFLFHKSYAISPADLRKSILTLAVRGKLCSRITTRRVRLEKIIELISGQHLLAHEHNSQGRGIPYLTGPSDFGEKFPVPTRWTESPRVVAEPGDILVTVKGSGVGKTNKLIAERTAISRQLMAVRVTGADPDFIHVVLMNAAEHFQSSMTGIAIPGIGRRDVLNLEVELPPLAEQRRIVAKVDELMALVDKLEVQQNAARSTATKLLAAAVAELTGERQSVAAAKN